MTALLLAFLLALVLDQGTRAQALAARLPGSFASFVGLALANLAAALFAVFAGTFVATLLVPEARLLFLAIALLFGGIGQIASAARPRADTAGPSPALLNALLSILLRKTSENAAFAAAGIAAYLGAPLLVAVGVWLGGMAALIPALLAGPPYTRSPAVRVLTALSGTLLVCVAIGLAATALRLQA